MIKKLFTADLYIKVRKNRFEVKNLSTDSQWQSSTPEKPFTTERLLVGQFSVAEPTLSKLVKEAIPSSLLKKSAQVVIQPIDMVEGGLSEVEERIFKELALGAGAHKVKLHVGKDLSNDEAIELLRSA